ncbi:MAG: VIT1/CCC1 transporter family protein [Candidatus Peregrinibacteria bacterium]|nr:VIT1/CCC1 transporter family protein [Candidatus Peregrinibacteria bacterium]
MKNFPKNRYNWLPDFVYGGIDGAVTTFAVVAGVAGAQLSTSIVLILGFANLFADGFSMAVGKYLSDHAEKQRIQSIRKKVDKNIHNNPEEKKADLRIILEERGFEGADLDKATQIMSANEKVWIDTIMSHKYNLVDENIEPLKGGVATFIAFNLIGFIPLAAYVFNPFFNFEMEIIFYLTAAFTLFALFIVGAVKAKVTGEGSWIRAGFETLFIGGAAAGIAYIVGYLLRNIG